jgi:organic radical activating enzyme
MTYRTVGKISAAEFLAALTTTPQRQADIFVSLGGDPTDHNYARLSFLTRKLRANGVEILTDRRKGVWLPCAQDAYAKETAKP